ncbi:MAG TPA: FG-GAP-like repeat-containing protein [Cyclobacteriaceae bacterium]|nr:FG-GAP-like repeat-containing protein [Cyclobacteriaceae bacterium]
MGSMGADFADLDNDGQPELFVTEMLPDSLCRKKTKTIFENWNKYEMNVQNGYYHQFSRNVLQKKINDRSFGEIGRMSGVAASEWSWGALLFDMDNDGNRDIFIANGIYKDLLDRDYLAFTASPDNVRELIRKDKNAILKLIDLMPSSPISNYAFKNEGNLQFKNRAAEWGLAKPMFSCGSAYGDLDNDGDLDLIINNINSPSIVYKNNLDTSKRTSIDLILTGLGQNTSAVGAHVTAFCGEKIFSSDNFVTRGFMSSTQPRVHLGLGEKISKIDSLWIQWPDDRFTSLRNVGVNRILKIVEKTSEKLEHHAVASSPKIKLELVDSSLFKHRSSGLNDFNRERLLPMMYSNETPSIAKGDVDGDGLIDFYVGGGRNQPSGIIYFKSGKFEKKIPKIFTRNELPEETKGSLIDVDGDGDLDLYLATGGKFFPKESSALEDKILVNDGKGNFSESKFGLPFGGFFSTSVSKPIDFDRDGDADLFVGDRGETFVYGLGGRGYLLENNGKGLFTDVTEKYAPDLLKAGMITDAEIADINKDGWEDIVVVGDWRPIVVLQNEKKSFHDVSKKMGLEKTTGWWHNIKAADFNQDGRADFVIGNHGLNTFFKVGDRIYLNDFDRNGQVEQVFCTRDNDGKYYPIADKDELVSQIPSLRKSILFYKDYSKKAIDELFPKEILSKSIVFEVQMLSSLLLLSTANGFNKIELPREAQYSTIYAFAVLDWDNDGVLDLITGGNQFQVKPQFGRYDASNGWLFKGHLENSKFYFEKGIDLNVRGQIRDINYLNSNGEKYILFAKHNDNLEIYKIGK